MIIIASYSNVSVTYTADGIQTVFSFPFDYLRKAFVFVEINGETDLEQGTDYTVSDDKTVIFQTAPVADTVLRIYRQTDTRPLVSWADASVLRAKDMTVQQVQELHILEEQQYWTAENAIIRDGNQWDAKNFPIKNVGDPVDPKDATNKEYVDTKYQTVEEKLDDLDIAVQTATEAKEAAELAQERAEDAQDDAEAAKETVETIASQIDIMARALIYDNVASMKADTTLNIGQTTFTKGYYTPNDGGASVYTIRTKTQSDVDDGGSIIFLTNGKVAELIVDNVVSVKQLGAKADGVTNDINAFSVAATLGNDIVVPSGSYNLSAPVFYNGKVDDNGTYTNYGFMHLTDKVLLKSIRNLQEEYSITYDSTYVQQGSTYNTKTDKIILAIIKSDNSAQKLLVVDPSTYTIDDTYDYTTLGHCNSLTYCPANSRIYVGTLQNNSVAVLDADTMTVVDTIDMGYNPVVFGYDLKNKIFVGVRGYNNGSVQANFYDADLTYIKTETYEAPYNYMISNGGVAYDGQLIILSHSGYALCDYFGNVLNYVKINRNTNGVLAILETEDCYIIDGVCYTAFIGAYGGATMVYKHNLMGEIGNLDNRATYYRYNDTDLDTLVQAGRYYVQTSTVGTNNFPPISKGGFMEVFALGGTEGSPSMCKQVFYQTGDFDRRIYIRGKGSEGSWSAWKNITPYGKIKNGRVTASVVPMATTGTHTVNFTEPFVDNVPAIFCQLVNSGTDTQLSDVGFGVYGASKTGFSVKIWNNMNTGITPIFYWVAVDIGDESV